MKNSDEVDRHPATLDEESLMARCKVRRQRRSGPGGQHRNKVETAVVVVHVATGVRGEASERRSQEENRRRAIFRLRVNLAIEVRYPVDLSTASPSDLWRSRCQEGKVAVNPGHADFPALLAEALDALASVEFEVRPAAEWLACTPSQLVKFLQLEPQAIEVVNRERRQSGKSPYR